MLNSVILTASIQVIGDILCSFIAITCALKKTNNRYFFINNGIAFIAMAIGDIYYNYVFRISHHDIKQSMGFYSTFPVLIFQIAQGYNWYSLIRQQKLKIFSLYNMPYLFFSFIVMGILLYYFFAKNVLPPDIQIYQTLKANLDILIWFFAIICLARTRTISIKFLSVGCLMLISADLTTRCLFMLEMDKVAKIGWVHAIWTMGVLLMAVGLYFCLKNKKFDFCHPDSVQANSNSFMLISSFIAFLIGFIFLSFFNLTHFFDIYSKLWNLPITLMFTMISAVLLGNIFSNSILSPIDYFLNKIEDFNLGKQDGKIKFSITNIYEFKKLWEFIDNSFSKLSNQLDREIKIATQVAHDIRSPLAALTVVIKCLPEIEDSKRILLRDAVNQIRDITNNLEKNALQEKNHEEKSITQIAVLIGHVLSERRIVLSNHLIEINQNFQVDAYNIFVDVIPSQMKRILTNIINNSCEATTTEKNFITVDVNNYNSECIITVIDTGTGVPQKIKDSLFNHGVTTKKKGSGIGLYHAKETLSQWGGNIEVISDLNINKGTTVRIKLPLKNQPRWYIDNLLIANHSTVICVDDNISILNAWQERFKSVDGKINLISCNSKEELFKKIDNININNMPCYYLIDYEFSGKSYTGIELIDTILSLDDKHSKIFLVTSRSGEKEIQELCLSRNIYMIPKYFALEIPIKISKNVFMPPSVIKES